MFCPHFLYLASSRIGFNFSNTSFLSNCFGSQDLTSLLARYRPELVAFAQREAGVALLRFESADDLVQTVHHEALRSADRFEWQGEKQFLGWVFTIARRCFSGRRAHWFALKRNCGRVLRLTWSGPGAEQSRYRFDPEDTGTGASTFANRRELLVKATLAMNALLPRDRDIVRWTTEGLSIDEQASRLQISREAAARAQNRALERLRRAYSLVS